LSQVVGATVTIDKHGTETGDRKSPPERHRISRDVPSTSEQRHAISSLNAAAPIPRFTRRMQWNVKFHQADGNEFRRQETTGDTVTQVAEIQEPPQDRGEGVPLCGGGRLPAKFRAKPSLPVVAGLRPKQVRAAMMLAQGVMAKDVASFLAVSPETVSRWRGQPTFHLFVRELIQESIEATKLGLVSLLPEAIQRLGQLMFNLDDEMALKGINLLFSKAGPLLMAINSGVQPPPAANSV
jgi:hypothetical protein